MRDEMDEKIAMCTKEDALSSVFLSVYLRPQLIPGNLHRLMAH